MSFNPEDSDVSENLTVMELVIGTLVRYEGIGRYRPFLANKWDVLDNGLKYRFYLREQLTTEDGKSISAETYVKNLKVLLKNYSRKRRPPVFQYLVGFDDYMAGKEDALGIFAPSNGVIDFNFTQKVSGLFEFLAMPYFGYYSEANFDSSGKWVETNRVISSGPYRVASVGDREIVLEKRPEWFSHIESSPQRISISSRALTDALSHSEKTIIGIRNLIDQKYPDDFIKINGTPTILTYAVLSPKTEGGIFRDEISRREFSEAIKWFFRENLPVVDGLYHTDSFYFRELYPHTYSPSKTPNLSDKFREVMLTLVVRPSNGTQNLIYNTLIKKFFDEFGIKFQQKYLDVRDPSWLSKFGSESFADVRIGSVDIGGEIEDWVIRMMFCSKLGVSFPDINQSVCNLTTEFEEGRLDPATYSQRFEEIVEREAVVVPLYHHGRLWLLTKDFEISRLTPTMGIIPFDQVGVLD